MRLLIIAALALSLIGCSDSAKSSTSKEATPEDAVSLDDILARVEADAKLLPLEARNRPPHFQPPRLPTATQIETFGPLSDFVGKSFRGIPGSDPDGKADIQVWSWALGGSAIKIQHAIEDGSYGGDSYVYKDAATGDLVYVYITNAGFRTEGIMTLNGDGSYTAEEAVSGHPSITMVRSTSRQNEDGSTNVVSEILDDGTWKPGHSFTYLPTDQPLPVLKPAPQP